MGKIIQYEFKKQRVARWIILAGLLAGILAFSVGIFTDKFNVSTTALGLTTAFGIFAVFYSGIESLLVFNKDLRTKQSHMLFMIPKSIWEILGGKFIAAILQMLFMLGTFAAAVFICFTVQITADGGLKAFFDGLQNLFRGIGIEIHWNVVAQAVIFSFLAWTLVIMTGFLAIIISRTLFLNSRYSGLFSIVLFFILNWLIEKGYHLIMHIQKASAMQLVEISPLDIVYYAVVCALLFGISGILADKKLSV